jgi:hypothetical protein
MLFSDLTRNPTRELPIVKQVVDYAHFYINGDSTYSSCDENDEDDDEFYQFINDVNHADYNHIGYGLYGMDRQRYDSFLKKIKKQYKNEPNIDNWQFVFGKQFPTGVNTPSLIGYYSKLQEMIHQGHYVPKYLMEEFELVNLSKMKQDWDEEIEKQKQKTQEFMRKIMSSKKK